MKQAIKIFLISSLVITFIGCNKETAKPEKNPEAISIVTKENNDEKKLTWVDNEYTNSIPKFTAGTSQEVYTNMENGFVFGAFDVTETEYQDYNKEVKKMGYTENNTDVEGFYKAFSASNGTHQLTIGYSDGYISITIIKEAK